MMLNKHNIYLSADAVPDTSTGSGSGGAIAGLVAQGLTTIAGLLIAQDNAAEQRKLQEKLALMSLQQQKELEMNLQKVQGEVAKMSLFYQALNMDKDRQANVLINKQKYLGIAIVGIGLIVLSLVVYKVKSKKK